MEESPYVPNSLPPALVVFGGSSYSDAIRMQRPFSSQVSDGKELNLSNLSASSFGLRPMDSYGGLPAGLVHLQNPFLHPALDARLPFGSAGAFRPVVTSSNASGSISGTNSGDLDRDRDRDRDGNPGGGRQSGKSLPSAFTPPNSSRRNKSSMENERELERERERERDRNPGFSPSSAAPPSSVTSLQNTQGGGGQSVVNNSNSSSSSASSGGILNLDKSYVNMNVSVNGNQRHRSISPSNNNNTIKEERDDYSNDRDENGTPNSDLTDRSTPEDAHLPPKRRRGGGGGGGPGGDLLSCPVCKMSLRPMELESHLLNEVEQLMCMSRLRRPGRLDEPSTSSSDSPSGLNHNHSKKDSTAAEVSQDSRWETYHRVRANRHSRLRLKTRRRRDESGGGIGPHLTCPVCQIPFPGSHDQLSAHVEMCLRKNGDMLDEDEPVDIEGDGDGGHEMEEYEWLAHRRGPNANISPNYSVTALNMTTNSRRRIEENDSLEVVVDGDDTSTYGQSQYTESDIQSTLQAASRQHSPFENNNPHDAKVRGWDDEESSGGGDDSTSGANSHLNQTMLLKALKVRIRELEKELKCGTLPHDGNSCLICMDKYKKPVVSISCWHVHCEECWLRTLGAKKLCPQCNMITSASDLRRIFL